MLYREIDGTVQGDNCDKQPLGAGLKNSAFELLNGYDPKVVQNLPANEIVALKLLLKDDSIVIQKSDKGNSVVILDKSSYVERVLDILSDATKFKKLAIKKARNTTT